MLPQNDLVFVSIAAYRDPQLLWTVADCLRKAARPELLRFGICWQHGSEEGPLPWQHDDRFRILDVPWRASKGACWARAEVMKLWQGEPWFLQVDSHCRFAEHWDARLQQMAQATGSPKPILSTYATAFTPGENEVLGGVPLQMALQGFTPEGIPHMRPLGIPHWQTLGRPLRARFLSAGFLFAPGPFVREVPYDPELYFLGEEAAMTLRAFSYGYDLFHPAEIMIWHDYERKDAVKHWDDHTEANQAEVAWGDRDLRSKSKVKRLLAGEEVGPFGLGKVRTVAEFERYAGLSFARRKAQDYTTQGGEPPNPPADLDWAQAIYPWMVRIRLQTSDLPVADFAFWYLGVADDCGHEIYRRDLSPAELEALPLAEPNIVLLCELQSGSIPARWTVWPVSRSGEWLTKIEGVFAEGDYSILLDGDD